MVTLILFSSEYIWLLPSAVKFISKYKWVETTGGHTCSGKDKDMSITTDALYAIVRGPK